MPDKLLWNRFPCTYFRPDFPDVQVSVFYWGLSVSEVSGNSGLFALRQDGQREKRSQLGENVLPLRLLDGIHFNPALRKAAR